MCDVLFITCVVLPKREREREKERERVITGYISCLYKNEEQSDKRYSREIKNGKGTHTRVLVVVHDSDMDTTNGYGDDGDDKQYSSKTRPKKKRER